MSSAPSVLNCTPHIDCYVFNENALAQQIFPQTDIDCNTTKGILLVIPVSELSQVIPAIAKKSLNTSICRKKVSSLLPPKIFGKLLHLFDALIEGDEAINRRNTRINEYYCLILIFVSFIESQLIFSRISLKNFDADNLSERDYYYEVLLLNYVMLSCLINYNLYYFIFCKIIVNSFFN